MRIMTRSHPRHARLRSQINGVRAQHYRHEGGILVVPICLHGWCEELGHFLSFAKQTYAYIRTMFLGPPDAKILESLFVLQ